MDHGLGAFLASRTWASLGACAIALAGCSSTSQTYSSQIIAEATSASLKPGALAKFGVAFITPSTVTGQEEDKPALALAFAKALAAERPDTRVLPLTETLSSVNRAGYFDAYERMITQYRDSGSLDPAALAAVGKATGARYIALLNMAAFQQVYHDRFGVFGLRLLQTKDAMIRLTLQVWDSEDGSVAWEGAQEIHMADETAAEDALSFGAVVEVAAQKLAAKMP